MHATLKPQGVDFLKLYSTLLNHYIQAQSPIRMKRMESFIPGRVSLERPVWKTCQRGYNPKLKCRLMSSTSNAPTNMSYCLLLAKQTGRLLSSATALPCSAYSVSSALLIAYQKGPATC